MTEPERATWREFVEWVARKRSDKASALKRAIAEVQTRREAELVCRFVVEIGPTTTGRFIDEWFAALRFKGIEPPADPPSAVEALESVAVELDEFAQACLDSCGAVGRTVHEIQAVAVSAAANHLRAKAKEFT